MMCEGATVSNTDHSFARNVCYSFPELVYKNETLQCATVGFAGLAPSGVCRKYFPEQYNDQDCFFGFIRWRTNTFPTYGEVIRSDNSVSFRAKVTGSSMMWVGTEARLP